MTKKTCPIYGHTCNLISTKDIGRTQRRYNSDAVHTADYSFVADMFQVTATDEGASYNGLPHLIAQATITLGCGFLFRELLDSNIAVVPGFAFGMVTYPLVLLTLNSRAVVNEWLQNRMTLHRTDTEEADTDALPTGLKRTGPNKMHAFAYPDGWSNEDMRAFARCAMRAMNTVDKKTRQPKQRFSEADITSGSHLGSKRARALRKRFIDLKYVVNLGVNKGYTVTERGKLAFSELLGYKRPPAP